MARPPKKKPKPPGEHARPEDKKAARRAAILDAYVSKVMPRGSVVLFDGKGKPRLRYQADYAAALSVTVEGDGCQALDFTFDKATQRFLPSPRVVKGCTP